MNTILTLCLLCTAYVQADEKQQTNTIAKLKPKTEIDTTGPKSDTTIPDITASAPSTSTSSSASSTSTYSTTSTVTTSTVTTTAANTGMAKPASTAASKTDITDSSTPTASTVSMSTTMTSSTARTTSASTAGITQNNNSATTTIPMIAGTTPTNSPGSNHTVTTTAISTTRTPAGQTTLQNASNTTVSSLENVITSETENLKTSNETLLNIWHVEYTVTNGSSFNTHAANGSSGSNTTGVIHNDAPVFDNGILTDWLGQLPVLGLNNPTIRLKKYIEFYSMSIVTRPSTMVNFSTYQSMCLDVVHSTIITANSTGNATSTAHLTTDATTNATRLPLMPRICTSEDQEIIIQTSNEILQSKIVVLLFQGDVLAEIADVKIYYSVPGATLIDIKRIQTYSNEFKVLNSPPSPHDLENIAAGEFGTTETSTITIPNTSTTTSTTTTTGTSTTATTVSTRVSLPAMSTSTVTTTIGTLAIVTINTNVTTTTKPEEEILEAAVAPTVLDSNMEPLVNSAYLNAEHIFYLLVVQVLLQYIEL